jgi:hypothetical protein
MPPPLYICKDSEHIHKIKSNNTPLAPYTKEYNINTIELNNIKKMLIYSDGLNEANIIDNEEPYTLYLKEDFRDSRTIEEFQQRYNQKDVHQEDDITYIFMHKEEFTECKS